MSRKPCLWEEAREGLSQEVQDWLQTISGGLGLGLTATQQVDEIIGHARQKQGQLEKNHHRSLVIETTNHKWDLASYFDRMVHWLDKFKSIGDVASSFDPLHAALPWAAFRFVLQAILAGKEHTDSLVRLLSLIPHFVFSGYVLELVYAQQPICYKQATKVADLGAKIIVNLEDQLLKLYSLIFDALWYCHLAQTRGKTKQRIVALFNFREPTDFLDGLKAQHQQVIECGEECRRISDFSMSFEYINLLEELQGSVADLDGHVLKVLVWVDTQERIRTLRKISDVLFRKHHEEIKRKRTEGTSGSGKTFLISRIIDHCVENAQDDEAIAFFYCKRDEGTRREPQNILRSILRQLSTTSKQSQTGRIHRALRGVPDRLEAIGTTFDIPNCQRLINIVTKDYSRTNIIVDALDECDRDSRWELLEALAAVTNENQGVRLFVSSRTDDDIQRHFQQQPIIRIFAADNNEDINLFVRQRLSKDSRWNDLAPHVHRDIESVFRNKSEGMFQWAALQVKQLCQAASWNESSIKLHLSSAPKGLEALYAIIWHQIERKSEYEKQQAKNAIQWVLCALKPLQTGELSTMMQIDPEANVIGPIEELNDREIQSICGNLLILDKQLHVWRFCHLSALEYIEKNHYSLAEAHYHTSVCSLKFLQRGLRLSSTLSLDGSPSQEDGTDNPSRKARAKVWDGSLVRNDYIIIQGLRHVGLADSPAITNTELAYQLRQFLGSAEVQSPIFQAWKSVLSTFKYRKPHETGFVSLASPPLEVAAIFGLFHSLRDWWDTLDTSVGSNSSALALAIRFRNENIWKHLIERGFGINTGSPRPLTVAIKSGYATAFDTLMNANSDVSYSEDSSGSDTPLKLALRCSNSKHQRRFVRRIVDRGAIINDKTTQQHQSALKLAALYACKDTMQILLVPDRGLCSPNSLLNIATWNSNASLIPFLVKELGADVNKRFSGISPLIKALERMCVPNIQALVALGAQLDLTNHQDRVAALRAVESDPGNGVWRLLLQSGMIINRNDNKESLLSLAIRLHTPSSERLWRILHSRADVNQILQSSVLPTPLAWAAAVQTPEVIDRLISYGANPGLSVDNGLSNAIFAACFHGRPRASRLLLDRSGIDVNQGYRGFFRNMLFSVIAGHRDYLDSKRPWYQRKWDLESRLGYTIWKPEHRKVLELLVTRGLNTYFPLYSHLESSTPVLETGIEKHEISVAWMHSKGDYVLLPLSWFFIVWSLHMASAPQPPLRYRMKRWQFPGILPRKFSLIAQVSVASRKRPGYFLMITVNDDYHSASTFTVRHRIRNATCSMKTNSLWKQYSFKDFYGKNGSEGDTNVSQTKRLQSSLLCRNQYNIALSAYTLQHRGHLGTVGDTDTLIA
ncbi:related to vegetatible incompatibility protein HET-E-1 [Fusarium fujikuroi IMI 58289]|uniref:Related to vegetatible incompatibility protein HET-E-1 n=1 Tax=Gibberella fujikuroi (strain CBS 195.34 / IMI 58289 / NRRL A-6831) TaxID=1279085 RepID=S0DLB1_GIBF5|nr:related to vegetatible incompatibility protein HET-E-1 [Fusarium fujikuroi IMI 58289]CCT63190.1 related to vegetatible incompatibility protein HET-E-1 [Fusarium fujikuroi IMI 58289]SCN71600.1 related to vegetatible incompatibility protein HET-E-1 [Fusarium fujikuroi]